MWIATASGSNEANYGELSCASFSSRHHVTPLTLCTLAGSIDIPQEASYHRGGVRESNDQIIASKSGFVRSLRRQSRVSLISLASCDRLNLTLSVHRRSYVQTWQFFAKTHETLGDNRLKFATQISDMSDELIVLGKEVEKNRKASKDVGTRLERGLAEQEALVEKVSTPLTSRVSV